MPRIVLPACGVPVASATGLVTTEWLSGWGVVLTGEEAGSGSRSQCE